MADTLVATFATYSDVVCSTKYNGTSDLGGVEWNSASESFDLSKVVFFIKRGGNIGDNLIWCEVKTVSGGVPGTTVGTSVSIGTLSYDDIGSLVTFTFTTKPSLTASTKYYFILNGNWATPEFTGTTQFFGADSAGADFHKWEMSSGTWQENTNQRIYIEIYKAAVTGYSLSVDTVAVGETGTAAVGRAARRISAETA